MLGATSHKALGVEVDDRSGCALAIAAFDSHNAEDMRDVVVFIENTMDNLDQNHVQNGEAGIMAQMTDEGATDAAIAAVGYCRDHPKTTLYNAAASTYVGFRALEGMLGVAK